MSTSAPLKQSREAQQSYGTQGDDETEPATSSSQGTLFLMRALTCASAAAEGFDLGMVSTVLVLMQESFTLDTWQTSLFVGILAWGAAAGALLGGRVADDLGRKVALVVTNLLLAAGGVILTCAPSVTVATLGRLLQGVGIGAGFVCAGVYMSELSASSHRGQFLVMEETFLSFGMVAAMGVSYLVLDLTPSHDTDWRLICLLSTLLPLACALGLQFGGLPESPRWLHMQGREEEAVAALRRVCEEEEEARLVQLRWNEATPDEATGNAPWIEVLSPKAGSRKQQNLVAGVGIASLQMLSGWTIILYYSNYTLANEMSDREAFRGSICVTAAKLLAGLIPLVAIDRVGRKPLLCASAAIMSMGLACQAYLYYSHGDPWLKVAVYCVIAAGFSAGIGAVGFVIVAEVFSNRERGKASALAFCISRLINGIVTSGFPYLELFIGLVGAWSMFALINLMGIVFIVFAVPETVGIQLEQMGSEADGKLLHLKLPAGAC